MGKARQVSLEKVVARMSGGPSSQRANRRAPAREEPAEEISAKELAATLEPKKRSVHLTLEPEVFDFFFQESGGKGHLARMETVLRAYADYARSKQRSA